MKKEISIAGCVIGGAVATIAPAQQKMKTGWNKQPNVIYIMADDLGIGDIEPYGQTQIKTPNLNKMR
jgi:hypothetical protein